MATPDAVSRPRTTLRNAASPMPRYSRAPSSEGTSMAGATIANSGTISRVAMPVAT